MIVDGVRRCDCPVYMRVLLISGEVQRCKKIKKRSESREPDDGVVGGWFGKAWGIDRIGTGRAGEGVHRAARGEIRGGWLDLSGEDRPCL